MGGAVGTEYKGGDWFFSLPTGQRYKASERSQIRQGMRQGTIIQVSEAGTSKALFQVAVSDRTVASTIQNAWAIVDEISGAFVQGELQAEKDAVNKMRTLLLTGDDIN